MKKLLLAAALIGSIATAAIATSGPVAARDAFNFSFNVGDVRFAYSDGYWDNGHRWHNWRNTREAREYRARFGEHWNNVRHTRARNMGWNDSDRDGVPNRLDNHPNNPRRD